MRIFQIMYERYSFACVLSLEEQSK